MSKRVVIQLNEETLKELAKHAMPFESPHNVIRRMLGLFPVSNRRTR